MLYHGGAYIPSTYGEDAPATSTAPTWQAATAEATGTVLSSIVTAWQALALQQSQAKAALTAQKTQYWADLRAARAAAPATGTGAYAPTGTGTTNESSGISTTTLLLIGGLGLAAVFMFTRKA